MDRETSWGWRRGTDEIDKIEELLPPKKNSPKKHFNGMRHNCLRKPKLAEIGSSGRLVVGMGWLSNMHWTRPVSLRREIRYD